MSPSFDRESAPPDDVDVTVESPAAKARDAAVPGKTTEPPAPAVPTRRPPLRAWVLAIGADLLEWALLPVFAPGYASPANDVLDLVVCALLVRWCGWHWAFLPSFVAELVPGVGLVPTWTAAVALAAWAKSSERPTA